MKKPFIVAGIVTAAALVSLAGVGLVSADTTATGNRDSGLAKAIADKFKLNQSDVQKVVDDQHSKNHAARKAEQTANVKTQLAQLVKDGKLTQPQADAITAKRAELEKQREANRTTMQNKSETERRTQMQTDRTALDTWLKDQGISTDYAYLLMGGPGGGKHGMGMGGNMGRGMMRHHNDAGDPTTSTNNSSSNSSSSTSTSTNQN